MLDFIWLVGDLFANMLTRRANEDVLQVRLKDNLIDLGAKLYSYLV